MSDNEWYTPERYIQAAKEVMDGIDLDPASCELANRTVQAATYYTKEENGLQQSWYGRIWLNPPYSHEKQLSGMRGGKRVGPTGLWVNKLLEEYHCKHVNQAIACLNSDTRRIWFKSLWNYIICFADKPIQFIRPGLKTEHHFFPTCFVYIGANTQQFIEVFSDIGHCVKCVNPDFFAD